MRPPGAPWWRFTKSRANHGHAGFVRRPSGWMPLRLLGLVVSGSCVLAGGGDCVVASSPPGSPLSRRVELHGEKTPIEGVIGAVYLQTGVSLNIQGSMLAHRIKLTGASLTVQQVMDQIAVALGGKWSVLGEDYCLVTEESNLDLIGAPPPSNEPELRAAFGRSLTERQIERIRARQATLWTDLSPFQQALIRDLLRAEFLKHPDRFPAWMLTYSPTGLVSAYDVDRMVTTVLGVMGLTILSSDGYPRKEWVLSVKLENPILGNP